MGITNFFRTLLSRPELPKGPVHDPHEYDDDDRELQAARERLMREQAILISRGKAQ